MVEPVPGCSVRPPSTLSAFDAAIGTKVAVSDRPDLILLDISMPAGNGLLIAERLQRLSATAAIPLIFMTANRDPRFRERAEASGASAFFEKPVDTQELLRIIGELLPAPPKRLTHRKVALKPSVRKKITERLKFSHRPDDTRSILLLLSSWGSRRFASTGTPAVLRGAEKPLSGSSHRVSEPPE